MTKKILLWILAVFVTLSAAVYQRYTGPTYPKRHKVSIGGEEFRLRLLRSHGGDDDAKIELNIPDSAVHAVLFFKHYPEVKTDAWTAVDFQRISQDNESVLSAKLPHQPPAGKLMYYTEIKKGAESVSVFKDKPVVIRFKGDVPKYILAPHIFFIFFAMLLANAAGLFAFANLPQMRQLTILTLIFITIGGLIFGPFVQKHAFGEFWTGVPFGWDLTDNKTLIGFLVWAVALLFNLKKENRYAIIAAALFTLIIFSIPHSMFGSELNRETGKVTQGFVFLLPLLIGWKKIMLKK